MSRAIQVILEGFTGISGAFSRVLDASRDSHLRFRGSRGLFSGPGGFTGVIRTFLSVPEESKRS